MNTLIKQNSIDSKLENENFNPEDDSEKLRRAMKGFQRRHILTYFYSQFIIFFILNLGITTNQKAIIEIITNRNNYQRQELKIIYKKLFNRNLVEDLHVSLSENVKTINILKIDTITID